MRKKNAPQEKAKQITAPPVSDVPFRKSLGNGFSKHLKKPRKAKKCAGLRRKNKNLDKKRSGL